jgi:hypothetical protein
MKLEAELAKIKEVPSLLIVELTMILLCVQMSRVQCFLLNYPLSLVPCHQNALEVLRPLINSQQCSLNHLLLVHLVFHNDYRNTFEMDRVFFDQIRIPEPDHKLEVGSGTHAVQTGKIMTRVEEVLGRNNPDSVLVEGDTNSVLASALAATKLHIKVGHLEAGLRS